MRAHPGMRAQRYRIFGIVLSCDFPLPELPPAAAGEVVLSIALAGDAAPALDGFERVHEWAGPGAQAACWCERRGGDYLFVFPGFVRYLVGENDHILCLPEPGCDLSTLRHLLLNQVVPRALGTRGRLIVHASAVILPGSGRAVAFLG
ncbi:MAG: hypothetical protein RQ826_15655, partial [Xanthomonadales bacterium]|nr:hypothetical protein [Xanthomonadales bacterium]